MCEAGSDDRGDGVPVIVELRCDRNPSRLLAKVGKPKIVDGNLIEIACLDCRKRLKREGRDVRLVLHRFDVLGELIETEVC